jgi:hypothetical protein
MMPITYKASSDGHFIHAVASGNLSVRDFIDYEKEHAGDPRLKAPLAELLEITYGSCSKLEPSDFDEVLQFRKSLPDPPEPHRCAILVSYGDIKCWDIAELYSGLVNLHFPESVIVFGDARTARIWLGIEEFTPAGK